MRLLPVPAGARQHGRVSRHAAARSRARRVRGTQGRHAGSVPTFGHKANRDAAVALQPAYLANPHLRDGSLQAVLPDWQLPDIAIYALYPSRKHLSPAVRVFLDFLVKRFATIPWL